jgi:hypothetical protein
VSWPLAMKYSRTCSVCTWVVVVARPVVVVASSVVVGAKVVVGASVSSSPNGGSMRSTLPSSTTPHPTTATASRVSISITRPRITPPP